MKKLITLAAVVLSASACSGMKQSGTSFTTHAESFNIVGFQLPDGAYQKAHSMVPANAHVHTVTSNPDDWTSALGVLNRIIGFSYTEVSGSTK